MSLFGEQRKRENYRGEKRDEGQRERRCGGGGGGGVEGADEGIKSVFCVVSETHFLVRG